MRSYRFFLRHSPLPPLSVTAPTIVPTTLSAHDEPEIFYQLSTVLRVKPEDEIILLPHASNISQSSFNEYHYQIQAFNKKELTLLFTGVTQNHNEPKVQLELILCLPNKPEKLEFILQKSVELGVGSIILAEGDFSQMKHQLRPDRLQRIITEAAEQSERAIIPRFEIEKKLHEFLEKRATKLSEKADLWVALERHDLPPLSALFEKQSHQGPVNKISLLVGPEGGFSDAEKNLMKNQNLTCFTLGRRILRMETAVIASLGILSQYL